MGGGEVQQGGRGGKGPIRKWRGGGQRTGGGGWRAAAEAF